MSALGAGSPTNFGASMALFRWVYPLVIGLAVAAYLLAIGIHARNVRQLGIDCLLSDASAERGAAGIRIARVDLDSQRDVVGVLPQPGDQLVSVGGTRIPSFVHFRRRVRELGTDVAVGDVSAAAVDRPAELTGVEADAAAVGPDRWVRIAFRPDRSGFPEGQQVAWLRLRPIDSAQTALLTAWMVLGSSLLVWGIVVYARRPGDPSAIAFYTFCAASVIALLGIFQWSNIAGVALLVYPMIVCGLLLAPLVLHLYLLFPRPFEVVRRQPGLTFVLVYGPALLLMALVATSLMTIEGSYRGGGGPALVNAQLRGLERQVYAGLLLSLIWYLVGIGMLVGRLRRGRKPAQHRQVSWLLGGVLAALPPIACLVYLASTDRAALAFGGLSQSMVFVTCLILAATHARALTGSKLVSPGGSTIRGVWYLAILSAVAAVYCLFAELIASLAGGEHVHWPDVLAAALTALALVVLWSWYRDRTQRGWDRRFVVYKHQLDKAVRRLSAAVDQLVETSQLAKQMLQSARDVVAAERGAVYLRDPSGARLELAARIAWLDAPQSLRTAGALAHALGTSGLVSARLGLATLPTAAQLELRDLDAELAFALERDGVLVGLLLLGPKADGTPYSGEERNFLAALVRTTTLALRSAEENRTIEALKEDLHGKLAKIAEQQRRISFLQGQLLSRAPADRSPPREPEPTAEESPAPEIRGSSPAIRQMLEQVRRIAASPSSVLIRGESGTGKELLARAIHRNSPRAQAPFVPVHCAALSPGLLEAELFGHVKGAYTGADRDRPGRFELAHGGTLFLDEIGDIALDTQIKLLRVLQERAFERVGSSARVQVDVRLIAATHQDLESLIRQGRFREDLFYRLNVISIRCPPLRERREDIFELALGFLEQHARRAGKHLVRIDEETMDVLSAYDWPGNVRQLENTIERAVVLAEGESITLGDLPPELTPAIPPARTSGKRRHAARNPAAGQPQAGIHASIDERTTDLQGELSVIERQRLLELLAECGGNKSLAARRLGIPRSTLFSKLARLGVAQ